MLQAKVISCHMKIIIWMQKHTHSCQQLIDCSSWTTKVVSMVMRHEKLQHLYSQSLHYITTDYFVQVVPPFCIIAKYANNEYTCIYTYNMLCIYIRMIYNIYITNSCES